jgi:hypothetical protein
MDLVHMTTDRATEAAGWMLTSLGVITSTATQEWTLAVGTSALGIGLLGAKFFIEAKRSWANSRAIDREDEIAALKHEITILHLRADEAAEQSRLHREQSVERATVLQSEIDRTRGQLAQAEAQIEDVRAKSSDSITIRIPSPPETAQPGGGDPK